MKKRVITSLLVGAMVLGVGFSASAQPWRKGGSCEGPRMARRADRQPGAGRHWQRMAEVLELTEKQQADMEQLFKAGRQQAEPLHEQLRTVRQELRQAQAPQSFDEKALRGLAKKEADIRTELLINRARTQSRIHALLTPEQKKTAELMHRLHRMHRAECKGRPGRRPGGWGLQAEPAPVPK